MKDIIARVNALPGCTVFPPAGQPDSCGYRLPADLHAFYEECGGVVLFASRPTGIQIVSPDRFVRANPVIAGCLGRGDMSYDWFIIGRSGEQYITIDLGRGRAGRCYDSFWDRHALRGQSRIIAVSFAELLQGLLRSEGECWYWLREGFIDYGDAYET
jgi:hypothetical protein